MVVINNVIELIGTKIKSLNDFIEETDGLRPGGTRVKRQRYLEKLSNIEEQLLDEETREDLERRGISQELGYFVAYLHHIKRLSTPTIKTFIYEKTSQRVATYELFMNFNIPMRNLVEAQLVRFYPDINFQLLEQKPYLSTRELQVLETRIQEGTNPAAARKLGLSESTVKNHLYTTYKKLGVSHFIEAVTEAYKRGLLQIPSCLELRRFYMEELLKFSEDLRFTGYDIKGLRIEGDSLVVELLEEYDVKLDEDFTESIFRESLEECLQAVGVNGDFEVFCEGNTVLIRPNGLKSRDFLDAYKLILEREIVE